RRSWRRRELKGCLGDGTESPGFCEDSLFRKISDPGQHAPSYPLTKALLNTLRYFTLDRTKPDQEEFSYREATPSRHFRRDDLYRWLGSLSKTYRPITYFYPGEEAPRVRLV